VSLRRLRPVFVLALVGATVSVGLTAHAAPSAPPTAKPCYGEERWEIKTLADPAADQVNLSPTTRSVRTLWAFSRPPGFDRDIRNPGAEMTTYKVTARLVKARWVDDPPPAPDKNGGDLDIHLVIAPVNDLTNDHTMVVEFPMPRCVHAKPLLTARMRRAREAFLRDCGLPGHSFHALQGTATIRGVGFFDRPHASGASKNGFELHPVIRFRSTACSQS
jgi:hypothetical protein